MSKSIAAKFNAKAEELMPNMYDDLKIEGEVDNYCQIDDIVFRRSEYLGGMAAVIISVLEMEEIDQESK